MDGIFDLLLDVASVAVFGYWICLMARIAIYTWTDPDFDRFEAQKNADDGIGETDRRGHYSQSDVWVQERCAGQDHCTALHHDWPRRPVCTGGIPLDEQSFVAEIGRDVG